ncbi:hypothetical protein GCM10028807_62920 [Spirosoma daeguense]
MKGFKVFNSDFTCREHQFSVNSEHKVDGKPALCQNGFHFCPKPNDCFEYYKFDSSNIVCEVEALGEIDTEENGNKVCTNHIRIGRKLTWHEVLTLVNQGKENTGRANSGNLNSGDRNSGNLNSGDRNSGDRNSGNLNSGDRNSGNRNSGDRNSGNRNSGNRNSGDWNSGNRNSGDRNSGNLNSGNRNSGDWNSGDWNSGDWNSGNRNSGDRNSGNLNSGNRNSGDWNSGNDLTGVLCTKGTEILMFNKPSGMTLLQWRDTEAYWLMRDIVLTEWVSWSKMSDQEKEQFPRAETQEGYLKRHEYRQAHATWWEQLTDRQRNLFTSLPNFSATIFKQITGIDTEPQQANELSKSKRQKKGGGNP